MRSRTRAATRRFAAGVTSLLLGGLYACAGPAPQKSSDSRPHLPGNGVTANARDGDSSPSEQSAVEAASSSASLVPRVALVEPKVLKQLEARGLSLAELVTKSRAKSTKDLESTAAFSSLFRVLRADLGEIKRAHPLAKVTSQDGYRLFDERWLSSEEMRFDLIGVFNRVDRRVLYEGTCGEVRLLYRLAFTTQHEGEENSGRLPLQLNVVFTVDGDEGCRAHADLWHSAPELTETEDLNWWLGGPLGEEARRRFRLKSVEVNLQSFRIQSRAHTTLGGHVEYVMRVFMPDAQSGALIPAGMHNMPDVARLKASPELKQELARLLGEPESLKAIDQGIFILPAKFLAEKAITVSPRALARPNNRPFSQLYDPEQFADLDLSHTKTIQSPRALLRRLDGDSCTGCHQSRGTIAGAHHVGEDAADVPLFVSLFSGSSTHLRADLERRRAYLADLRAEKSVSEFRPTAETQGREGDYGAPCGLGDPGFASLLCKEGLSCVALEDQELGTCMAPGELGAACEYGELVPGRGAHRDLIRLSRQACEPGLSCHLNRDGFAEGDCETTCRAESPDLACSPFTGADELQACLRGGSTLSECASVHVFETGLRRCDEAHACRQDYVCMKTEQPGVGGCVPAYFIVPLRLDGHPGL